jgi:hypothetical protein
MLGFMKLNLKVVFAFGMIRRYAYTRAFIVVLRLLRIAFDYFTMFVEDPDHQKVSLGIFDLIDIFIYLLYTVQPFTQLQLFLLSLIFVSRREPSVFGFIEPRYDPFRQQVPIFLVQAVAEVLQSFAKQVYQAFGMDI